MNLDRRVESVASAIRRYLGIHPQAADTLEGIHRWWIDWGDDEESPDVTRAALQKLIEEGAVASVEVGSRRLWHAARRDA